MAAAVVRSSGVRLRPVFAVAVLAIALAASRDARADAAADSEKAHNAYVAHQYDEAESRLRALLDPQGGTLKDPDAVADARMYLGATLVAEKKNDEAAAEFALLLSDKPEYQPDALRVSLDAIDAFTDARARNRDKLAAIQAERVRKAQEEKARAELERQKAAVRLAMLERMAGTEVVTTQNSRLIALIPFGAGQFQNGQTALAWTLLVSEGLFAVGSGIGRRSGPTTWARWTRTTRRGRRRWPRSTTLARRRPPSSVTPSREGSSRWRSWASSTPRRRSCRRRRRRGRGRYRRCRYRPSWGRGAWG